MTPQKSIASAMAEGDTQIIIVMVILGGFSAELVGLISNIPAWGISGLLVQIVGVISYLKLRAEKSRPTERTPKAEAGGA